MLVYITQTWHTWRLALLFARGYRLYASYLFLETCWLEWPRLLEVLPWWMGGTLTVVWTTSDRTSASVLSLTCSLTCEYTWLLHSLDIWLVYLFWLWFGIDTVFTENSFHNTLIENVTGAAIPKYFTNQIRILNSETVETTSNSILSSQTQLKCIFNFPFA